MGELCYQFRGHRICEFRHAFTPKYARAARQIFIDLLLFYNSNSGGRLRIKRPPEELAGTGVNAWGLSFLSNEISSGPLCL